MDAHAPVHLPRGRQRLSVMPALPLLRFCCCLPRSLPVPCRCTALCCPLPPLRSRRVLLAEPGGRGARAPGAAPGAGEGEPFDGLSRTRDPGADPSMATAGMYWRFHRQGRLPVLPCALHTALWLLLQSLACLRCVVALELASRQAEFIWMMPLPLCNTRCLIWAEPPEPLTGKVCCQTVMGDASRH